ncbi:MAG: DUF3467 domain-containing protein [Nanoarchaeota archaeon]
MLMKKQINVEINSGEAFFADEVTIVHNPTKMVFDFKSVTPRFDVRNREVQPIKITHDVVVVDIFMAKEIIRILDENIKNYEKRFGKISVPKAIEKAKKQAENKEIDLDQPTYFG